MRWRIPVVLTIVLGITLFVWQLRTWQKGRSPSLFSSPLPTLEAESRSNPLRELLSSQEPDEVETRSSPVPFVIPASYVIPQRTHVYQSFNNCGPASLSMQLSYFGIQVSQQELGRSLRPYQVAGGDNDDKSVTLEELASEAEKYGLVAFHRPNGNPEMLQEFIANDLPVVIRTWLQPSEDIGHYRVIRGYDKETQEFIQDDSLQGENLRYSYSELDAIWRPFNYEYLVLVPQDKQELARQILEANLEEQHAWEATRTRLLQEILSDPDNMYSLFNLSVAEYELGNYAESVRYFEQVESRLPSRMLWYQIEPIQAYFALGQDERVFSLTDSILQNQNRAFSELYYLRGQVYLRQDQPEAAREQFSLAILYHENYEPARAALAKLE